MDAPTLPTPRSLLTSLITTLTTTPISGPQTQQQETNPPYDQNNAPTNPLKSLSPSHRAILSTLHVLFPTGVLLQSLDLLDRGLVVRVVEEVLGEDIVGDGRKDQQRVIPPQAHVHLPESSNSQIQAQGQGQAIHERNVQTVNEAATKPGEHRKRRNVIYLVRSSQAPKSRFKDRGAGFTEGGLTYTVRLESWNCSCAAFAFESFPGQSLAQNQKPWLSLDEDENGGRDWGLGGEKDGKEMGGGVEGRKSEVEWEFGGLSCDGKDDGGKVPVCKHLLACILVERWGGVLGSYVKERVVGREEMAGLGCEG
jgi:hypothetical protein